MYRWIKKSTVTEMKHNAYTKTKLLAEMKHNACIHKNKR